MTKAEFAKAIHEFIDLKDQIEPRHKAVIQGLKEHGYQNLETDRHEISIVHSESVYIISFRPAHHNPIGLYKVPYLKELEDGS